MLTRHLLGTSSKIGIGANRAATATCFLKQYGYLDPKSFLFEGMWVDQTVRSPLNFGKIGAVVLDDGMQVLNIQSLHSCDGAFLLLHV